MKNIFKSKATKQAELQAELKAKKWAEFLEYRGQKWAEIRAEYPDFDNLPPWVQNTIVEKKFNL